MSIFTFTKFGRSLLLSAAVIAVFVWTAAAQTAGTFTDSRDKKTYKTVNMPDGKTWMAENLNFQPKSGKFWCYNNKASNCKKYGRLYDWNTAKTACHAGWRLPSREEWGALAKAVGGTGDYGEKGIAGKVLKSADGWYWYSSDNGVDRYGFSAVPGGCRDTDGSFNGVGEYGDWWTASEYGSGNAYGRNMYYGEDYVDEGNGDKSLGFSVRCIED